MDRPPNGLTSCAQLSSLITFASGNIPETSAGIFPSQSLEKRITSEFTLKQAADKNTDRSPEFEGQVLEHLDMLYAVALKLTRNTSDAQDLTQNTAVKALRFHNKFEQGTYIKAWLLTILRNTFINEYRRRSRRPSFVELTGLETQPESSRKNDSPSETPRADPAELMELLEDEVKMAIESLPEDFRKAVIMADLEDYSYKEIADAMECPLGTVMSRLYRGRKLLREKLESYAKDQRVIPRDYKEN